MKSHPVQQVEQRTPEPASGHVAILCAADLGRVRNCEVVFIDLSPERLTLRGLPGEGEAKSTARDQGERSPGATPRADRIGETASAASEYVSGASRCPE